MMKGFREKETARVWGRGRSRAVPAEVQRKALRKLVELTTRKT